jgi:hypothetical protein
MKVIFHVATLAILLAATIVSGQRNKKVEPVIKEDVPHIGCDVCRHAIDAVAELTSEAREKAPYKKIDEGVILEILDNVCDGEKEQGSWIRAMDIISVSENGRRYLTLKAPGGLGKCGRECVTIQKSCKNLMDDDLDRDELSSLLWKNKITGEDLTNHVCQKMCKRCSKDNKNKPIKNQAKRTDYPFEEMSEKDIELENMMKKMNDAGLGGGMSLYSRDDLEAMRGEDGEFGDMMGGGMGSMGGMAANMGMSDYEPYLDETDAHSGYEF